MFEKYESASNNRQRFLIPQNEKTEAEKNFCISVFLEQVKDTEDYNGATHSSNLVDKRLG